MKAPVIITAVLAALSGGVAGFFVGKENNETITGGTTTVLIEPAAGADLLSGKKDAAKKDGAATDTAAINAAMARSDIAKRILAGEKLTMKEIFAEPGQMARLEALLLFARSLSAEGLESALKEAREMPRGMDSMMAMQLLMSQYGEVDPKAAIEYASGLGGMGRGFGTASILSTWASSDPVAAGKYLSDNIDTLGSNEWMNGRMASSVASEWAKQNPAAALAWAKGLPDAMRGDAMEQALTEMTSQNPQSAIDYVLAMEAGDDRTRMIDEVASQYGRMDPAKALDWAQSLSGEDKTVARREVLESWARSSPSEAAAYVDSMDAETRTANIRSVSESWSWNDPGAAAAWVNTQPQSETKTEATREIIGNWMRTDSVAASEWVSALPAGQTRDSGIVAMVSSREMRAEPDARAMWAGEISDPDTRAKQVTETAPAWLATDYDAASTWINSVAIPQESKAALLSLTPEQLKSATGGGGGRDGGRRPF